MLCGQRELALVLALASKPRRLLPKIQTVLRTATDLRILLWPSQS